MMKSCFFIVFLTLATATLIGVTGCEDAADTHPLAVSPSRVTMAGDTNSVVFSVSSNSLRTLSLPLEWRVTNPALGFIQSAGGVSAAYTRTADDGVNTVIAKDQYDSEGLATVVQE